ncbi:MAG: HAMP domain-containing histidine kinase [Planctomycetes bacterium]|nr:HAMP domain-containing histidine kinase [Planctomycetota bacterium]
MSLRARLVLQAGFVVLVAALLAGLLTWGVARTEIDRVREAPAPSFGDAWLLLDDAEHVLDASDAVLRAARVTSTGDGGLELRLRDASDGGTRETVLVLDAGALRPASGAAAAPGARRVSVPGWPPAPDDEQTVDDAFGLVLALVAAVAALALVSLLLLARRVLRPLERITDAATRLSAGDLAARAGVEGADELGELGRAFDGMADAFARTEALRRDLVSDVAHELRTPLTALRCQLDAVRDGLRPADEAWDALDGELVRLARLVDDLQQLALADAGQLAFRPESVVPREAVGAALDALRALRGDDLPRLVVDVDMLPALRADPERLQQVLRNLLVNAAAHTPRDGTITLDGEADASAVRLRVSDTGPGLAPDDLPRVFERFFRGDAARARRADGGGSGLGLAIAKRLVEGMQGSIEVVSRPGHGARFEIVLPRA